MRAADVFPCAECASFTPRIRRYHSFSWAWENALFDLREHLIRKHREVPENEQQDYIRKVVEVDAEKTQAGRPR